MSTNIDITIVGGGMVGLSMAAALAKTDLNILLVEKNDLDSQLSPSWLADKDIAAKDFDIRVSAISPGNRSFLSDLGIWQHIPKVRQANYQMMKVWDGDGTGKIEFSAARIAQPDLGVIIENRILQSAALKQIQSLGNIQCAFGQALDHIETFADHIEVCLQDGTIYKSRLLIGADGAHSQVRELLKIESTQHSYEQIAFVANVETEFPHQQTALQRFTPHGPVAFLPLPKSNLCSVVWSLDKIVAERGKIAELSTEEFVKKLQYAFESKLGKVTPVSKHLGFPLVKRHSQRYLAPRVALVGDAAHTIHPLAGQGVNLGFQDAACLANLIGELAQRKRDFGLMENLRPFERERKTENLVIQNAMSGFKHLFANQSMPVTLFRNFAMSALDRVPVAKEVIIKKAMGL